MLVTIKTQWRELRRSPPGHRFQNRYANAHRERTHTSLWRRVMRVGLALVLFAVGVVFAFIPGPAILFFALAGALLATESRGLARTLDWAELRLRALGHGMQKHWAHLGLAGRIGIVTLGAGGAAGAAFASWHFLVD